MRRRVRGKTLAARLAAFLALVLLAAGAVYLITRPAALPWVTESVPQAAQVETAAALAGSGYPPQGAAVWAGAAPGWQAPGRYRLFFTAVEPGAEPDVYSAEVAVNAAGRLDGLPKIAHLTDTAAGAEGMPSGNGRWLAFATGVAGRYQSITAVALDDLENRHVFVLNNPPENVALAWAAAAGSPSGATLEVTLPGQAGNTTLSVDPQSGRVLPDETLLAYVPAARGEQAFLPNLVSRVRELPGVGPEKIAFLENVFFTAEDRVTRWWHGLRGAPAEPLAAAALTGGPSDGPAAASSASGGAMQASPAEAGRAGASGVPEQDAGTAGGQPEGETAAARPATEQLPAGRPASPDEPGAGQPLTGAETTGQAAASAAPGAAASGVSVSPLPVAVSASATITLTARPAASGLEAAPPAATREPAVSTSPSPAAPRPAEPAAPGPQSPPSNTPPTAAGPASPLAYGVLRRPTVRPDPQRPYAEVEVLDIDPALLQVKMVPGTWEPRPSTGLVGTGVIPAADRASLVAAFNGGFAAMHGAFGMMVDRKVYLPARTGIATLAVYEDGSIRMGTWGTDIVQTPDMVSYRQNCPPLIENGVITAETGKMTLWGLSVANEVYLYRSGLGVTANGRLVYAAGRHLSAYTLARALQVAGAVYAMQLDVDEYHVAFITYDVKPAAQAGGEPAVTGAKLREDMRGFDGLFLKPFQLDFFYLLERPAPLANAVRGSGAAGQQGAAGPAPGSMPDLPGQIAFASNRDGNWEIYTTRPGRADPARRLTNDPADDLYPAWAPDATRLAFTSRRAGSADVYTLDLASLALRQVTNLSSEEWNPAWSADGARIAYQSDRNGQSDVFAAALDGSGEVRLTPWQANTEAPHWSPDGKRIVVDSDVDVSEAVHASINIYIMSAETIGATPLHIADHGESPTWSPDGKRIAYQGLRGGRWQVLVVNADGSGLRQLTLGAYDARYPTWSPDGRWLAFAGNKEGHWELYVMPVDGPARQGDVTYPLRLTYGSADNSYPAWGN